ncbi:MAG: murein biosynthesis integral membrane protein MurJ [Holosporales bacterium]|nr:murein biosynthesis integral membrane protein MurJ [Holosporales bacterium]
MSIARRFFAVSFLTVISRVLGIFREAVLSHFLGAGAEMDAFLIAFKFPSFFRKCFAEGGFQSLFIPYYIDFTIGKKEKFAFIFSSHIFTILFYAMLFLTIFVFIFVEEFVAIMAPGFLKDPEKFHLAVNFTKIVFPNVAFVGLSTIYTGIMMARNKFLPFSLSPILVNIILILSIIVGNNTISPGYGISIGVLSASIIQLIFLHACVKSMGIRTPALTKLRFSGLKPRISKRTKEFLKKLTPVIAGAGVSQLNVFVDTFFGSFLGEGTVSLIYFADRFIQFPLALFGISMATVILPEISSIFSSKNHDRGKVKKIQEEMVIFTLRMAIPSTVGLMAIAYPIVDVLYGHGKFTESSVYQTSVIIQIFAIGVPAYVLAKIFASVLFAQKDSKTPVLAAVISVISNIILNAMLIRSLGIIGLSVSTSIAGVINAYVMYKKTKEWFLFDMKTFMSLAKITVSSITMLFVVNITKRFIHNEILFLIFGILLGIITYFIALLIFKDKWSRGIAKKMIVVLLRLRTRS